MGIPNAAALAERCEAAAEANRELDRAIWCAAIAVPPLTPESLAKSVGYVRPRAYSDSLDAAMTLLEPKNDWRRLTPKSISVYAASPYNADAQVRYDGYGATPALQLCAAFFKMLAAREAKASAIEARRAATAQTDAVHESAVGAAETPNDPGASQEAAK